MTDSPDNAPQLSVNSDPAGIAKVTLTGDWRVSGAIPSLAPVEQVLAASPTPREFQFDAGGLIGWNTALLAVVLQCREWCEERHVEFTPGDLPAGLQRLIQLSLAVPEKKDARRDLEQAPLLERLGTRALTLGATSLDLITFIGESLTALGRWVRGRARFRWADTFLIMQEAGPQALGIVALINFLVGLILAFVGAVQLTQFGAAIYVADLVAIGTVREMGCIMTGIIICGRTGAAFAAQLGTMKVNEEIDAFTTFGFPPVEFLVLPRLVALMLMMPILCVFADLIAILGGFTVATLMLDVSSTTYLTRTVEAITLNSFLLGIFKGAFFGMLVAVVGCWRGMRCGSNAAAVGEATTSAVVVGIAGIVAADGIFAVLCNALNI
jgi:phospholipid/cholesterol/gamma-HCH transport system permease protein